MNWTRVAGRKSPGATGCVATLHFLLYAARIHRLTFTDNCTSCGTITVKPARKNLRRSK
jgi:hypothetical protein